MKELGSMGFDKVYKRLFDHIFDPILARFDYPIETRPYVMKFYLSGITAVVMEWIDNNCEDSMDVIIQTITNCIINKRNCEDIR